VQPDFHLAFRSQLALHGLPRFALGHEMTAIRTLVANSVWIYVIFPSRRVRPGLLSSCGVIGSSSLFGMIAVLRSTRRLPND
jgi:hypothetical protein